MAEDKYGVEVDLNKRWEEGVPHHPESIRLMRALMDVDREYCSDYFRWKKGGDGDNGETLMYELDIIFERRDALAKAGTVACPKCGKIKPKKPKLGRINDSAVTVKCACGCIYTARIVMRVDVEILEVKK